MAYFMLVLQFHNIISCYIKINQTGLHGDPSKSQFELRATQVSLHIPFSCQFILKFSSVCIENILTHAEGKVKLRQLEQIIMCILTPGCIWEWASLGEHA